MERTHRVFSDLSNYVSAAFGAPWRLAFLIKFYVRCKVVWKIDFVASFQIHLQFELFGGGINLS